MANILRQEGLTMARGRRWWLITDFGMRSDAGPLYRWLDQHQAMECGDDAATFESDHPRPPLEEELRALVDGDMRLYLIGPRDDGTGFLGRFIQGARARAHWRGFADESEPSEDYAD